MAHVGVLLVVLEFCNKGEMRRAKYYKSSVYDELRAVNEAAQLMRQVKVYMKRTWIACEK